MQTFSYFSTCSIICLWFVLCKSLVVSVDCNEALQKEFREIKHEMSVLKTNTQNQIDQLKRSNELLKAENNALKHDLVDMKSNVDTLMKSNKNSAAKPVNTKHEDEVKGHVVNNGSLMLTESSLNRTFLL